MRLDETMIAGSPGRRLRTAAPGEPRLLAADAAESGLGPRLGGRTLLKILAVTMLIVGCRWWIINRYGSPVPFFDQWDAEAARLYLPWMEHHLPLSDLIAPHNEHRILCTRLLVLGLLKANGQWDPRLQMSVNALIAAVTALLLMLLLARLFGRRRENVILVAIGLLWVIPYGLENALWGFQSHFYMLILLAVLALWGLLLRPNFSPGWWLGAAALLADDFTLGSGFIAGAAVLAVKIGLGLLDAKARRSHVPSAVAGALALAVGVFSRVSDASPEGYRAFGVAAFFRALGKALSWPYIGSPWPILLLGLPAVLLAVDVIGRRGRPRRAVWFTLGLAAWVVIQAMAMAWARGKEGVSPCSRYADILAVGPLANLLALMLLADARRGAGRSRWLLALTVVWGLALGAGLYHFSMKRVVPTLYCVGWANDARLRCCLARLPNRSPDAVPRPEAAHFPEAAPHPDLGYLADMLCNPRLQEILPAALQAPAALRPAGARCTPFVENGVYPGTGNYLGAATIGSYDRQGNAARGSFRSGLIETRLPFLQIPVAGYLKDKGMSLQLVVEDTQQVIPIRVAENPHEAWHLCEIRAPSKAFRIVAEDRNPDVWLAFAAPRQVGWLSHFNERALGRAGTLTCIALVLLLCAQGLPEQMAREILGVSVDDRHGFPWRTRD
jgi:hypothetical protein